MQKGEVYHVMTKSIAGYVIFNNEKEFLRMKQLLSYYRIKDPPIRFYYFNAWVNKFGEKDAAKKNEIKNKVKVVEILAYCLMPTHLHLVLQQVVDNGVSIFMNKILNSYTRYFNIHHQRKGPLWTQRFKRVKVSTDEQLMHLTRYVHLNPATAYLVNKPESWDYSSYSEYLGQVLDSDRLCEYKDILSINPKNYKHFVDDQINEQRELAVLKGLTFD